MIECPKLNKDKHYLLLVMISEYVIKLRFSSAVLLLRLYSKGKAVYLKLVSEASNGGYSLSVLFYIPW